MAKSKKQKGGGGGLFLSMALGAALAAGAGYYATHKEEVDREAKKKPITTKKSSNILSTHSLWEALPWPLECPQLLIR